MNILVKRPEERWSRVYRREGQPGRGRGGKKENSKEDREAMIYRVIEEICYIDALYHKEKVRESARDDNDKGEHVL